MAPWPRPRPGRAGPGSHLDLCPQHLCVWQGGLPPSLLGLGLPWRLGFGTRSASQVAGSSGFPTHPPPAFGVWWAGGERSHGRLPAPSPPAWLPPGPVFAGSGEGLGAGVRLLVSAGLHAPGRHGLVSLSLLLRRPQGASAGQGLHSRHSALPPRHMVAPLTPMNGAKRSRPDLAGPPL